MNLASISLVSAPDSRGFHELGSMFFFSLVCLTHRSHFRRNSSCFMCLLSYAYKLLLYSTLPFFGDFWNPLEPFFALNAPRLELFLAAALAFLDLILPSEPLNRSPLSKPPAVFTAVPWNTCAFEPTMETPLSRVLEIFLIPRLMNVIAC